MKKFFIILLIPLFAFATEKKEIDFKFNKKILYIGAGLTLLSFAIDNDIKEFTQKNKSDFLDKTTNIFNEAGSGYAIAIPISTYALGYYLKDQKLAKASRVAIASALVSASIVFPIKYITHRKRPDDSDHYSFPSGHTAFAFAIFGSYAKYYNEGITPYILYSIPVLTGFSRIYKNKHYLSDVVAGGVIGLSSVYIGQWLEKNLSLRWGVFGSVKISKKEVLVGLKYKL
ncbi:phosphatase PAP2 family protein [Hydrogenothermus marinus]|uniref:Membrane-associated phospholipid phosphatase n=1 Tax=Hydrogenothermus marinus TaxID=133270 RepID=A0A3M0BJQ5_9AQUI|nr:phosphatase PAP2 family protein [Hydrogenothermus marinus]RMA97560.1 membrane-associated phospholipid phosphatase [Hydrogenothermus marinus]